MVSKEGVGVGENLFFWLLLFSFEDFLSSESEDRQPHSPEVQLLEAPLGVEKGRECGKIIKATLQYSCASFSCEEKGQGWTTVAGRADFLGIVGGGW